MTNPNPHDQLTFDAYRGGGIYDDPDTLTLDEFRRVRYTLADVPATWMGRPFIDVELAGDWL